MPDYRLRFGTYDLPRTLIPVDEGLPFDTGETRIARRPGAKTQPGLLTGRSLVVRGEWTAQTADAWLAVRDAVIGGVTAPGAADLWFGRDDRYYKAAQIATIAVTDPIGHGWGVLGGMSLTFSAAEYPHAIGTATHTPALAAGGGTVNYTQGDAPTLPTWTITIGTGGAGKLTLTNAATGEACIIARPGGAAWQAGDVVLLQRDGGAATLNGVAVVGLWDRRIPRLVPGANAITLAATGGPVTVAALAVSYPPRFR